MLKLPVDASLQLTLFDDLGSGFVTKLKTASFFDAVQDNDKTARQASNEIIVTRREKLGKRIGVVSRVRSRSQTPF
ncbi:MAG: hypothetical protein ACLPPV_01785 [Candidatus Korobacteraceae bacterium]|jgi:hypothetical protein